MFPLSETTKTDPTWLAFTKERVQVAHYFFLNGHVDVIPAGPEDAWETNPWAGTVRDGKTSERSLRYEAGLAAYTMAMQAIVKSGLKLKGDVTLEYTVDEELSGNGTLAAITTNEYAKVDDLIAATKVCAELTMLDWCGIT